MFSSDLITLNAERKIHVAHSAPASPATKTPVVAIHGLGGSSQFWLKALEASGLTQDRDVYAYDMDGHGKSPRSGREPNIQNYVDDIREFLDKLNLKRVVLIGHSMNGIITSLFSEQNADRVEQLILLNPVRNLTPEAQKIMIARAETAETKGLKEIADAVAATAVAKAVAASDPSACALIRDLVASTDKSGYAAACLALSTAPVIDGSKLPVPLHLIAGAEDYLVKPEAARAWAGEVPNGKGSAIVLENVGHWGAIEAPARVGRCIAMALAPTSYDILMGTFRSPYLYTLTFDMISRKLQVRHVNEASGGHNWLDVSPDGKTLYATVWGEPPKLTSYDIVRDGEYATTKLSRNVPSEYMSGYVCSNDKAMYSACGPQVDTFLVDEKGTLRDQPAVQSFSLLQGQEKNKANGTLDFGGLRHGGHSADLSPDGTKMYVADIGRNCVWIYHVNKKTGLLTEASKNVATRPHDGPRHAWPHPNGHIVYSLQEHSSYVDAFRLTDDATLEFIEGGCIIPDPKDCDKFWADEVRLSPLADVLFGSTRGLKEGTRGFVTAWNLRPDGTFVTTEPTYRFETKTSGGWANAIAVCPNQGRNGEVFMTLTDSEVGFVQILMYTSDKGFEIVDEVKISTEKEHIMPATTVWL
ncbi:alpha/beta-hydrolase [Cutaneotrichosporon oleaginosum]|uniref:Alpha/beta-hydrolase n=1 Tax=Cutaneotrichosporon oleaginosum TaxID=879819 RepID=A0A0J0XZQ2_9TREE|nr:alpha/beta-hydrolase [Cutaneotrichosporon oleaginosum]KLT46522.1 alpha/beta-hydrolase [Cutaneotrichosporon oleaginosum]TXT15111.1 hypothetical protein COLE_01304 [Cutaneotrichosporon oleaginosum]